MRGSRGQCRTRWGAATGTYLHHSLWSERDGLGELRGGRKAGRHPAVLSRLLLSARRGWPGSYVPEDLHDEQVDGEHEEGALKANHHLLPRELNLPCQDQTQGKSENNRRNHQVCIL